MAGWTGLEPATSAVTVRRSNQLNYHPLGILTLSHYSSSLLLFKGNCFKWRLLAFLEQITRFPKHFKFFVGCQYHDPGGGAACRNNAFICPVLGFVQDYSHMVQRF